MGYSTNPNGSDFTIVTYVLLYSVFATHLSRRSLILLKTGKYSKLLIKECPQWNYGSLVEGVDFWRISPGSSPVKPGE
mgnify:CR=1 FL=1